MWGTSTCPHPPWTAPLSPRPPPRPLAPAFPQLGGADTLVPCPLSPCPCPQSTRAVYERILDLRIATPQIVINYALLLEEHGRFEDSFKVTRGHLGTPRGQPGTARGWGRPGQRLGTPREGQGTPREGPGTPRGMRAPRGWRGWVGLPGRVLGTPWGQCGPEGCHRHLREGVEDTLGTLWLSQRSHRHRWRPWGCHRYPREGTGDIPGTFWPKRVSQTPRGPKWCHGHPGESTGDTAGTRTVSQMPQGRVLGTHGDNVAVADTQGGD